MFTLKSEPQDKLSIIQQGFHLYKHIFWLALPYSLFASIFIFIPALFIDINAPFHLAQIGQNISLIASAIICWLLGFIFLSALMFRIYCITQQIPLTFINSISEALFKLIPLLLLGVLYALMVVSGTLFLIIPGVILAISLMFSFILFLTDNQNVLQTLLTSHRLVWGNWWHTLFVVSFPLLLDFAVSFAMVLSLIGAFNYYSTSLTTLYFAVCFFNIVIQALFIPLIFSTALILLNDLRTRQSSPLPRW
jgi:hypothetical protein